MTPGEVRSLSAPEYLAMIRYMDAEAREIARQARKRGKRR